MSLVLLPAAPSRWCPFSPLPGCSWRCEAKPNLLPPLLHFPASPIRKRGNHKYQSRESPNREPGNKVGPSVNHIWGARTPSVHYIPRCADGACTVNYSAAGPRRIGCAKVF